MTTRALPASTRTVLKEWAVACEALGRGQQLLLLRKGGIREEGRDFRVDHHEFLLFPTYEHQRSDLLKPAAREQLERLLANRGAADRIEIRYWATVAEVFEVAEQAELAVIEELEFDGAAILFFDAAETCLSRGRFAPSKGPVAETLRDLRIDVSAAPAFVSRVRDGYAVRLAAEDAASLEAPLRRWVTEVAADEILVMPLMGKQRCIGVLAVDNRRGGRRFAGDDETLLEGLSHQAVIAIENARLVEDLRRSREQVRRADRLGTLGTLAAGLAHEINNPLVSIHTFLSMAPMKRHETDEEFWGDYHALASREVDRIRRLVETMRSLGRERGPTPARETFDPAELVKEALALVEREAGRANVMLRLECDPHIPKLVAVRDHIHQVFLNLLLNALHATPPGGRIEVRVYPEPAGDTVCIDFSDSGVGISEENLSRVFDPFFTTKDPDRGSGLGLMICHRLVSDHGGTIEVRSREGEGSTFGVRLPAGEGSEAVRDARVA